MCGDDGCAGQCGYCPTGQQCNIQRGVCEACVAQCSDEVNPVYQRGCGPDQCGRTCGTCSSGSKCFNDWKCLSSPESIERVNLVMTYLSRPNGPSSRSEFNYNSEEERDERNEEERWKRVISKALNIPSRSLMVASWQQVASSEGASQIRVSFWIYDSRGDRVLNTTFANTKSPHDLAVELTRLVNGDALASQGIYSAKVIPPNDSGDGKADGTTGGDQQPSNSTSKADSLHLSRDLVIGLGAIALIVGLTFIVIVILLAIYYMRRKTGQWTNSKELDWTLEKEDL